MSEAIHKAGRKAYKDGIPKHKNPYPKSKDYMTAEWEKFTNWNNGWTYACFTDTNPNKSMRFID